VSSPVAASSDFNKYIMQMPSPSAISHDLVLERAMQDTDFATLSKRIIQEVVKPNKYCVYFVHINAQFLLSHTDYFRDAFNHNLNSFIDQINKVTWLSRISTWNCNATHGNAIQWNTWNRNAIHEIAFSESWLIPGISNNQIFLEGYEIIRLDRLHKRGGGVSIYIRADIKYKILATSAQGKLGKPEYIIADELIVGFKIYCVPLSTGPKC
jgi:hypothetical protein